MLKRLLLKGYKSLGIFIVFYVIGLFFCIIVGTVITHKQQLDKDKDFFSDNSYAINFNFSKLSNFEDFYNILDSEEGIILGTSYFYEDNINSMLTIKAIYYNDKLFNTPPLKEGRFISKEDFHNSENTVVIGSNYLDKVQQYGEDRYLIYDNVKYKVIGVMGYDNKTSHFDNWAVINLKQLMINDESLLRIHGADYKLDSTKEDVESSLSSLSKKIRKSNTSVNFSISSNLDDKGNSINRAIKKTQSLISILMILITVLFINIINATYFWINKKRKEIAIRRAFGASNKRIIKSIILELQGITLISSFIAIVTFYVLLQYNVDFSYLKSIAVNPQVYLYTLISLTIFSSILALVSSIIPINQMMKMEINEIIRER